MVLVELAIKGISYSQAQSGAYALILNEVEGDRNLPIIIGAFEAQSIAIGLEKEINPPRPITHDLMAQCFERFKIIVKQIIIHKLVDGVFYSSLICERDKIEEIIDAPQMQWLYQFVFTHLFLLMRIFYPKLDIQKEKANQKGQVKKMKIGSKILFKSRTLKKV